MDAKKLSKFKKMLMTEQERILNNTKNSLTNELNISSDDLADETDLAASTIAQNLVFKLRDRERHLMTKITEALTRIDDGTFGVCIDCEEPIEPRRLEARPSTTMCISCKERQERQEKIYA